MWAKSGLGGGDIFSWGVYINEYFLSFFFLSSENSFVRGEASRNIWVHGDLLGFTMYQKDDCQKCEALCEGVCIIPSPTLHQQHDRLLCMFQGSYLDSNIQCLNKTRMHLPLQAWATVTAYFSRGGWMGQWQGLLGQTQVDLVAHCSALAASRKIRAEPSKLFNNFSPSGGSYRHCKHIDSWRDYFLCD